MTPKKKNDALDFEAAIKKLEGIVRRLEEEQVPLEESLQLFAEGKRLARACEKGLSEAENRVRQIIEDSEGNLKEIPLDTASEDKHGDDTKTPSPHPPKKGDDLPF